MNSQSNRSVGRNVGLLLSMSLSLTFGGVLGCSAYRLGPPTPRPQMEQGFAEGSKTSAVCVLRPSREAGFVTAVVRDNGALVGATEGGSYFCYQAEPGDHHITIEAENKTVEAWLNVGVSASTPRTYYLEQDVESSFQEVVLHPRWLAESEGNKVIHRCQHRLLDRVPKDEGGKTQLVARAAKSS